MVGRMTVFAAATIGAVVSQSLAGMTPLSSITIEDRSTVEVIFEGSSAGAQGALYFLGAEHDGALTRASSSDENDLGMYLFSNKGTTFGATVALGEFNAGSTLHFAYLITKGVSVAPTGTLLRTDVFLDDDFIRISGAREAGDVYVFNLDIEDIKDYHVSDFDFNDVRIDIRAVAVPAPGSAALAFAGLGFGMSRRRERE